MNVQDVIIVLSRPAESGNVGAVCRAMKNMGFSRLRLVNAAAGEPLRDEIVRTRAIHAVDVWEQAEFFSTLEEAVSGCALVIGTTRRAGRRRKDYSLTAAETAALLRNQRGSAALVFGNERTGLEDGELRVCNMAAHIPASASFPSLNLSHAVQIFCYELFLALQTSPEHEFFTEPGLGKWVPLGQEGIGGLVQSVTGSLEDLGFYKQPGRADQERFFRDIFSRAGITQREAEYLEGIFAKAGRLGRKG
ncbi:MAG: TrmJ/YjtD family RNA methyltransferase [Treponema sp.]|jgi:tRNA/rRNA methyltransferase/tRNA (cytidine32/uridine32-2'-O)-methyltransferase|nr:TrmJ/YjtD family RNA methyltransferase [Treponema sp.]